jgi:precorrin-3B synthase
MAGDRCPGVLRLHEAADGWLARVRLPGGRLTAESLDALAEVADLGNGVVELTARASLQVRGLRPGSVDAVASALAAGGLLRSRTHERVRNILASPLAGRHPDSLIGTDELVAELDRRLCADPTLSALSGRFLFAVHDGSRTLAAHRADVSLEAVPAGTQTVFALHLARSPTTLTALPADAVALALRAARGFLELACADRVEAWGLAALPGGPQRLAQLLGGDLALAADPHAGADPHAPADRYTPADTSVPLGVLVQRDGRVALTALPPLGRVDGAMLRGLAECSRRHRGEARISPQRTVSLVDLHAAQASSAERELSSLGFVCSAGSGWSGLSACAGIGACAKALVDVRRAAQQRATLRDSGAVSEHWSGCERSCGRPPDVGIAITAGTAGVRVELDGEQQSVESVPMALELLAGRVGVPA